MKSDKLKVLWIKYWKSSENRLSCGIWYIGFYMSMLLLPTCHRRRRCHPRVTIVTAVAHMSPSPPLSPTCHYRRRRRPRVAVATAVIAVITTCASISLRKAPTIAQIPDCATEWPTVWHKVSTCFKQKKKERTYYLVQQVDCKAKKGNLRWGWHDTRQHMLCAGGPIADAGEEVAHGDRDHLVRPYKCQHCQNERK